MNDDIKVIQDALSEARVSKLNYLPIEWVVELGLACQNFVWEEFEPAPRSLFRPGGREWPVPPAPKRPPPWYVGLSKSFRKDITGIDRKLQGRILEALSDIASNPTTPRGDTIKPLQTDLNGCWRYRIGDYRLVYFPDASSGDITLLTFAARGAVYGD